MKRSDANSGMTIHEFGETNPEVLVMLHPLGVW